MLVVGRGELTWCSFGDMMLGFFRRMVLDWNLNRNELLIERRKL